MTPQPRVLSAQPDHPGPRSTEPSTVQIVIDRGTRNGPIARQTMTPDEALELAEALVTAARIVLRVNAEKENR